MKAQLINRSISQSSSFILQNHTYNNFLKVWHYHPELELAIILESTGTRFVGDSIEKFEAGEIVLIGKNLPHLWLNDKAYFEESSGLRARAHVVHFHENFAGGLLKIPEMACINDLFERAGRGIKFEGDTNNYIIQTIAKMFDLHGYEKVIALVDILKCLSDQKKYSILSSAGFVESFQEKKNSKIVPVYEYIMNNFTQEVNLKHAAELANMHPSSFSRFFKRIQKKTFSRFLNEVRIGYACKLLIEQKYNISEVCYKSGFNNVSNFNRQFKSLKKMSPTQFIQIHERMRSW